MRGLCRLLHARRELRRNQSGFALATTLAILLLTAVLVSALLGLTFATTNFSGEQVVRDSESRAADAAIQSAIGLIARDEPEDGEVTLLGSMADPDAGPDDWNPCNVPDGEQRPPLVRETIEGHDVSVYCTALQQDAGYAPTEQAQATLAVLGSAPGDWWRTVAAPGAGNCPPLVAPAGQPCMPWGQALDRAELTADGTADRARLRDDLEGAGVVHTGPDPMFVVGNARVTKGTAAVRNASRDCVGAGCPYVPRFPGISASSTYYQGHPGPLADAATPCGLLAPPESAAPTGALAVAGAQVNALGGLDCDVSGLSEDTADEPGVVPPNPVQKWTPERIRDEDASRPGRRPRRRDNSQGPNVAAYEIDSWDQQYTPGCPIYPGEIVEFRPGAYPRNLTAKMNEWFRRCQNAKFWFLPGDYWFDVDDGAGNTALEFTRGNNLAFFGTPNNPTRDSRLIQRTTRPMCDPTAPGVHLTLSARTSIHHTAGQVAICGRASDGAAIWQEANPNLGWTAPQPTTIVGGVTSHSWSQVLDGIIGDFFRWLFGPGGEIQNEFTTLPAGGRNLTVSCGFTGACQGTIGFSTTWEPTSPQHDPGPAPISSASLHITAEQQRANDVWNGPMPKTEAQVFLKRPDGTYPANPTCTVSGPRINDSAGRDGPHTIVLELLEPGAGCAGRITDRTQLLGARIDVAMRINSDCGVLGCTYGINLRSVELVTDYQPQLAVGGNITCTQPNRGTCRYPEAVASLGGGAAEINFSAYKKGGCAWYDLPCHLLWYMPDSGTVTFSLPELTDLYAPNYADADPEVDAPLTSLDVKIRGISSCKNWHLANVVGVSRIDCRDMAVANNPNSTVTVRVRNSSGGLVCSASFPRLPEWNQVRAYDLHSNSGCRNALKYNKDLLGKRLEVELTLVRDKSLNYGCRVGGDFGGNGCNWWRYQVDYIGVSTTVDTSVASTLEENGGYAGPPTPFRITSNDLSSTSGARFNIYGSVVMPRADMEVHWLGPPAQNGDPIITARNNADTALMIGSLQSIMGQNPAGDDPNTAADDPRAGIVCCSRGLPAERYVELRAYVDPPGGEQYEGGGELRATALVRVRDLVPPDVDPSEVSGEIYEKRGQWWPGWDVVVERFQYCNRRPGAMSCSDL